MDTWRSLSAGRQAVLVAAVLATFAGVILLAFWAQRPTQGLLYAGLGSEEAGRVVGALDQMKTSYEVRGDAIFVDVGQRDRVRMSLAERGLPRRGPEGYELLENLDGFGTTTEMFNATYWRAKEGELARTILSLPGLVGARVHIANVRRRPFLKDAESTSAAVTVRTAGGQVLEMRKAQAIRYLVALAVPGLGTDRVTVIDAENGVILKPDDGAGYAAALSSAAELEQRLSRQIGELLSARVGEGRARVQVAVELDQESEVVKERILDPESRVAIHLDNEETSESSNRKESAVTVSSNLPESEGEGADGENSQRNQTRERVNYEISEVLRERNKQAGAIKRISVAVLVDGIRSSSADGTETWQPRPEAELEAIRNLVKSAVGYEAARGDMVTVESLEFAPAEPTGELMSAPGFSERIMDHVPQIVQATILAVVLILLFLFVLRPMRQNMGRNKSVMDAEGTGDGLQALQVPAGETAIPEIEAAQDSAQVPEIAKDPMTLLREVTSSRPEESSALIKSWLSTAIEQEETA